MTKLYSIYERFNKWQCLYDVRVKNMPNEYLSYESAMDHHDVTDGIVRADIYATLEKSREEKGNGKIKIYHQIPKHHFFGFYKLNDGQHMAEPEKAFLDYLFLNRKSGNRSLYEIMDNLHVEDLSKKKIEEYSRRMGFEPSKIIPLPKSYGHMRTFLKEDLIALFQ